MILSVIRTDGHFDLGRRPRRWAGSRPEAVLLLVLAVLFPAVLWAMPPNNRHACITASSICESFGENSAALYFIRQARDEELLQPIGIENCFVPERNPLLNRIEATVARLEEQCRTETDSESGRRVRQEVRPHEQAIQESR